MLKVPAPVLLTLVALAAVGCGAGVAASRQPDATTIVGSPTDAPRRDAATEAPASSSTEGCGPAEAPVFEDPGGKGRPGGNLFDVKIVDPEADSNLGEVQQAGFVTKVHDLGKRSLRHVSFIESQAKRPSYAVFYLADAEVGAEDTEASFMTKAGVIVVQTPSSTDVVPSLKADLRDRATAHWTSNGYDWRLGAATTGADAIDLARTWECS